MTAGPELWDRRWSVTVDTLELPGFDVEFTVTRTHKPEPNTCELAIYNLNEDHVAQLEQLEPAGKRATSGIACKIEAGYAERGTHLVWLGDLRTVETVREGPDWVTRLSSGDGEKAWQNARKHVSYGPRTGLDTALRAIVRALGVGEGNLSKYTSKLRQAGVANFPHGTVITGAASRELRDFARSAGLEVSVQNGELQLIDAGKALDGEAILLSSDDANTGLIGSPSVDSEGVLTCSTLMIPDVVPGRLVMLDAVRSKGAYKIIRSTCRGQSRGQDWGFELEATRYG